MPKEDSKYYSKPESLQAYTPKTRRCLRCQEDFRSNGAHHRVCKNCKKTSEYRDISASIDNSQGFCP